MIFSFILEKIATIIGWATILRNILVPSFKNSLQKLFIQSLSSFFFLFLLRLLFSLAKSS